MHRYRRAALAAVAATAAAAPTALAQTAGVPGAPIGLEGKPYLVEQDGRAQLYFRTSEPLSRRFDGLIEASVSISGHPSSVAGIGRDGSAACYTGGVKNGSRRPGADPLRLEVGRRYRVAVRIAGEDPILRTLTMRRVRPGDRSGKPLEC